MTLLNIHIPIKVRIDGAIKLKVDDGIVAYPRYTGSVDVEPKTVEQTLETANTTVYEDIKVRGIPYYETSNVHGLTAIIGGNG